MCNEPFTEKPKGASKEMENSYTLQIQCLGNKVNEVIDFSNAKT